MTQELARLEILFEAIPLAFATFDADLKLVSANNRYRELTGLDSASSAHRPIYDAFPNALADLTDQIDNALDGVPVGAALATNRMQYVARGGAAALDGALGHARHRLAVSRHHREVSDHEDLWTVGNAEV